MNDWGALQKLLDEASTEIRRDISLATLGVDRVIATSYSDPVLERSELVEVRSRLGFRE